MTSLVISVIAAALRHQSSKFMLKTSTIFVTTIIVEVLNVAIAVQGLNQGQTGKSLLNSTVFGTPLEEVYGGNVEGLRNIRVVIDLEDVNGPCTAARQSQNFQPLQQS